MFTDGAVRARGRRRGVGPASGATSGSRAARPAFVGSAPCERAPDCSRPGVRLLAAPPAVHSMHSLLQLVAELPVAEVVSLARPDMLLHLAGAIVAGGAIGMERSFHGRPAGFRTHTLVCLASALLMLLTVYQPQWFHGASPDSVRIDPPRM